MKNSGNISVRAALFFSLIILLGYVSIVGGQQQPAIKPLSPQVIQPSQPIQPAQPVQQPAQPIQPPAQRMQQPATLPQYPHIMEFSLTPDVWLSGEHGDITFRWNVEPGPSGSPIRSVAISRTSGYGPEASYRGFGGSGEYVFSISSYVSVGKTVYTLTATDNNGARSMRTVEFEVKSVISLRGGLSLVSLSTEPAEISEGAPFTFIVQIQNRSGMGIPGVDFPVYGKDISVMEASMPRGHEMPPPNQGELDGQAINTGTNTYRIRCSPGVPSGKADSYLFEIRPVHETAVLMYIWSRLELSRSTSTGNFYRLRYGGRPLGE